MNYIFEEDYKNFNDGISQGTIDYILYSNNNFYLKNCEFDIRIDFNYRNYDNCRYNNMSEMDIYDIYIENQQINVMYLL